MHSNQLPFKPEKPATQVQFGSVFRCGDAGELWLHLSNAFPDWMHMQEQFRNAIAIRLRLGAALLALAVITAHSAEPSSTPPLAKTSYPAYLNLDGRWYGITTARFLDFDPASNRMIAEDTTARACQRSNGSQPTANGFVFAIGIPSSVLAIDSVVVKTPTVSAETKVTINTVDGDIVCAGEVPEPPMLANGFE